MYHQLSISEFCTIKGSYGGIGVPRARVQMEKRRKDGVLVVSEATSALGTS
jgi:hypothetical protein